MATSRLLPIAISRAFAKKEELKGKVRSTVVFFKLF